MISTLTHGPFLWFLNRGTGVILLVVLTLSLALGMLTAGKAAGGLVPRFVPQALHRNLSILALALVLAHIATAVLDTFVDIRWWQALSPVGATYEPLWLGLGTLSFDLMVLVALTTAVRARLGPTGWRRFHLLGYLCWPVAFAHGAGMGTDAGEPWARWIGFGCIAVVGVALTLRLTQGRRFRAGRAASVGKPNRQKVLA